MEGTIRLGAKIAQTAFGAGINDMPAEMLQEIINNSDPGSAFSLSRTGRKYRQIVNQKKNKICDQYLNDGNIRRICTTSNDPTHKWCRETSNLCGKVITNFRQLINLGNGVYRIPDGVVVIAKNAFENIREIRQIIIPDSVTEIKRDAFRDCSSLTSITIPDSVTEIRESAFCGCRGLTSVTIPSSVTEIKHGVFCDCASLTSITIPDSVTEIGKYAFYGCRGLTSVTVPDSVTEIGGFAFRGCTSLASVSVPGSLPPEDIEATEGMAGTIAEEWRRTFPDHTTIIPRN